MAITQFFHGIRWKLSDSYENFYIIGLRKDEMYTCAYHDRNTAKKSIMQISGYNSAEFDFHHIVEQQHLADISYDGSLHSMYEYQIPTVLLHNREHQLRYNSILHIAQTRHLYMSKEMGNIGMPKKQIEAMKLYCNKEGRKQLKERTLEMKNLYSDVYESDLSLKQIAMNILDHYLRAFN